MCYRCFLLIPFYLISVEWSILKLFCAFEIEKVYILWASVSRRVATGDQLLVFLSSSSSAPRISYLISTSTSNIIVLFLMSHTLACFWIRVNSATRESNSTDFIAGFYFIYATATTIGYGDVTVLHSGTTNLTLTYLFGIAVIALGLVFDAYAQSKIRTMVMEINRLNNHFEMQFEELEDWLAVRNMTQGVHLTRLYEVVVRGYFSHMITNDVHSIMQTHGFLDKLPSSFKESIVMSVTFKYFRRWYSFFKHLNITVGVEIMAACRTRW